MTSPVDRGTVEAEAVDVITDAMLDGEHNGLGHCYNGDRPSDVAAEAVKRLSSKSLLRDPAVEAEAERLRDLVAEFRKREESQDRIRIELTAKRDALRESLDTNDVAYAAALGQFHVASQRFQRAEADRDRLRAGINAMLGSTGWAWVRDVTTEDRLRISALKSIETNLRALLAEHVETEPDKSVRPEHPDLAFWYDHARMCEDLADEACADRERRRAAIETLCDAADKYRCHVSVVSLRALVAESAPPTEPETEPECQTCGDTGEIGWMGHDANEHVEDCPDCGGPTKCLIFGPFGAVSPPTEADVSQRRTENREADR